VEPIGRDVGRTGRDVNRAFAAALAEAGGTLPTWLILLELRRSSHRTQLELARAVGIEGATLTRHLDGLEESGLVRRVSHPNDRRATRVELTGAGEEAFARLRKAAGAFDRRLRAGFDDEELAQLRSMLARLRENATRAS
jgi:MarR family transcriptional regulator, transcriptional regulator for hemolysin